VTSKIGITLERKYESALAAAAQHALPYSDGGARRRLT
jgi:hypothetical protein